jgi:hypothetical protein
MSRLSQIEERLISISEAAFQELCDHYLALHHADYKAYSRRGSQVGKENTVPGTPDTFFLLEDGRYLFMEATQQTNLLRKFQDDLTACADESKTHISVAGIKEVILCFNSRFDKVEEVKTFAQSKGLGVPRLVGLDELAMQIHLHHRNLAATYLGLPLDTGQVVPIKEFLNHYNASAQSVGTSLDNPIVGQRVRVKQNSPLREVSFSCSTHRISARSQ